MTTQAAKSDDLTKLDDDQLISQRATLRTALERLPPNARQRTALAKQHDALAREYDRRARADWRPAEMQAAETRRRAETRPARRQP